MLSHMRLLAASLVAGLAVAVPPTAQQTVVDVQSLMTTPVWLYRGAQLVSQGTGFFYGNLRPDGTAEAIFLVTNYHVVTGHAPNGRGVALRRPYPLRVAQGCQRPREVQ